MNYWPSPLGSRLEVERQESLSGMSQDSPSPAKLVAESAGPDELRFTAD